jgi:hypothetical protein
MGGIVCLFLFLGTESGFRSNAREITADLRPHLIFCAKPGFLVKKNTVPIGPCCEHKDLGASALILSEA